MLVPMGEEAAEGGAFEAAVSVMRAYAEQDAEFAEALQLVVREEARLGRPLKREEWPAALQRMLVVPELGVERMAAERMVATVARELTDQWERMVGVLEAFCEREGHARVPDMHLEGGEALGQWVRTQRVAFKGGRLVEARVRRLEALGMVWAIK